MFAGLPLRENIFSVGTAFDSIQKDLPTVYITAGKTGSIKVNEAVSECLARLLSMANVIHQCGDHSQYNYYDQLSRDYEDIKGSVLGTYHLRKFVLSDEIGAALNKADLVVTRSGAHITAELIALEKPCLLIPIPWVSHNEQNENARVLKNAGLAKILDEKDLNGETLLDAIRAQLQTLSNYTLKVPSYKDVVNKDAAKIIAQETLNAAQKKA